jgi:hypothetical protein
MNKPPLESFDARQLKLWRRQVFEIYYRYVDLFEEYGFGDELRKAEQLYRDVREVVDEVFNSEQVEGAL